MLVRNSEGKRTFQRQSLLGR